MTERAAILREIGKPLELDDIVLADIAPDQVRVRIAASGVCHSDLSMATGALPAGAPCVLGHEGAGVIEAVGSEVHHVEPGDHVVIAWTAACQHCWFCQHGEFHLCRNAVADSYAMPYAADVHGNALFTSIGVSSFATATNCLGRAVVPIDRDIPLDIASLVGCGVATGAGAAFNTAPVEHGSSVAVIGLGGVGLAALMASVVRGAARHRRHRPSGRPTRDGRIPRRHPRDRPRGRGRRQADPGDHRTPRRRHRLRGGRPQRHDRHGHQGHPTWRHHVRRRCGDARETT